MEENVSESFSPPTFFYAKKSVRFSKDLGRRVEREKEAEGDRGSKGTMSTLGRSQITKKQ